MAAQFLAGLTPWGGAKLNEYVNRLGESLARASGSEGVFTFLVIYSPQIHAQAFPGGYVFVNSGVVSLAEGEAELAWVLAHEIAHVNARHWQRSVRRRMMLNLIMLAPLLVGAGPVSMGISYGTSLLKPLGEARFSRAFELDADRLAATYLMRAGYDADAGVRMLERLRTTRARDGIPESGLLSTHPTVERRRRNAEKILRGLPRPALALETTSEFEGLREEVRAYDRVFSAATGAPLPGEPLHPPKLQRRSPGESKQ